MLDAKSKLSELKEWVQKFTADRDWQQFHSPKVLTQALSIEAAELMEIFLWEDNQTSKQSIETKKQQVEEEMADVFWWLLQLSWQYDIDLTQALKQKMELNARRYPIERAKGNTLKYTELENNEC